MPTGVGSIYPMTTMTISTAPITRALRRSDLAEYAITEKDRLGRTVSERHGWRMERHDDHVRIFHTEYNDGMSRQYAHETRSTINYANEQQWIADITAVLVDAGCEVEVVTTEIRFGNLNKYSATAVQYLRVTR